MSRTLKYTVLLVLAAVLFVVVAARPTWLSDTNSFLMQFVNHEFLNVLGVILAITLASAANIHLEFNNIERRYEIPRGLATARAGLKKSAYWLIGLFLVGVLVVVTKPLVVSGPTGEGLFNSFALVVLLWMVLILYDLTELVFGIPSDLEGIPEKVSGKTTKA